VPEYVQQCLEQDTLESLNQAADLSPTNGVVYARLALATLKAAGGTNETERLRAEFFTRHALKLAPDSGEVQKIREQVLAEVKRAPAP
jgi:hypothetical protein